MSNVTALIGLADAYAADRDPAVLQQLQEAVRHAPGWRPDLDVATETAGFFEAADHAGIVTAVQAEMPGAFLSPAAHAVLGAAYDALGDEEAAGRERALARLALDAITSTGDGSAEAPWTVLRISDEYDVLRSRGRSSRVQRLVERDGRRFDVHECDDGSQLWFDIGLLR